MLPSEAQNVTRQREKTTSRGPQAQARNDRPLARRASRRVSPRHRLRFCRLSLIGRFWLVAHAATGELLLLPPAAMPRGSLSASTGGRGGISGSAGREVCGIRVSPPVLTSDVPQRLAAVLVPPGSDLPGADRWQESLSNQLDLCFAKTRPEFPAVQIWTTYRLP